ARSRPAVHLSRSRRTRGDAGIPRGTAGPAPGAAGTVRRGRDRRNRSGQPGAAADRCGMPGRGGAARSALRAAAAGRGAAVDLRAGPGVQHAGRPRLRRRLRRTRRGGNAGRAAPVVRLLVQPGPGPAERGDARGAAIRPVAVEWSRGRGFTPSAPDADHSLLESAARSSARQTGATDAHRITRAFLWWPRRPLATLDRKLRQGRKAATVSID